MDAFCYNVWWRKPKKNASSQPLYLVLFLHVHLTFGCFMQDLIFAMVVSPIDNSWEPTHVIIGIFETHNITCVVMANQIKVIYLTK
jgi:hypothetical protein